MIHVLFAKIQQRQYAICSGHARWANNFGITEYINNRCQTNLPELTALDILFGNKHSDPLIGAILLQAKYFIFCCRIRKQVPKIHKFAEKITSIYYIDKYIATKNLNLTKFETLWEKYKNLVLLS
jgi:hypothetical protein